MEKGKGGFANPEKILKALGIIKPGMTVADFGCGAGYFAIPAARLVGPNGTVVAIDIREAALNLVDAGAKHEGLFQVRTLLRDLEKPEATGLKPQSINIVVVANILYQVEDKSAMLEEAQRILRPRGRLLIMEWQMRSALGPPKEHRVEQEQAKSLATQAGFQFEREFPAGDTHYGLLFEK